MPEGTVLLLARNFRFPVRKLVRYITPIPKKSIKSPGKGAHTLPPKIHHISALECAHSLKGRSLLPLSSAKSNRHMQMASTRDNEGIRIRNYLPTRDRCMYGKCGGRKFLLAVCILAQKYGALNWMRSFYEVPRSNDDVIRERNERQMPNIP